ncbi:TrkA C-terminal domain-containing protein [Sulfurovum sp.]|uniref:COG3400 family protein n=1 Tax=Sulfurovum sp. TaxID=1969726 RepID=UPI002868138B|nr:TrkA C-terminal domain-containing protein [Sulfurovum sp.]
MKNILILASGSIAKHFIDWVSKNRVAENQYYVTCYKADTRPEKIGTNITIIDADPSSFSKLKGIMEETRFSNIFIVLEDLEDTRYVLKNLALIKSKIRIILVNQWDDPQIGKDQENISIINTNELMAAHLYDHLPNVPLVAQNVGLGQGEIMEVHVPFGSAYAYRHIGSILQRKWKIAALYRDGKQMLPTNATMIRPNDTLLILGKPIVLDGVYKTINKRLGLFPEPFGKDIYLILDLRHDKKNALIYLKESIYLVEKLEDKALFVRILYPNDFVLIDELKTYESEKVTLSICYKNKDVKTLVEYDIHEYNIGLIMNSIPTFEADELKETLYSLKKLVFLFGDKLLYNIKSTVVLMGENEKMESISSLAFDISETLGLGMTLGDFDPEGDFENKNMIIEHYETLADIFNVELKFEQRVSNPIRELSKMEDILQVAPFEKRLNTDSFKRLISSKIQDFLLTTHRHPKLLVPFEIF